MKNALARHVALVGFMGAGKSTLGRRLARAIGRGFVDVDRRIERQHGSTVPEIFANEGEAWFREREAVVAADALGRRPPAVVALGGGAVMASGTRAALREAAVTVFVDVPVSVCWRRASGGDRPLARDADRFRGLHKKRLPVYRRVADVTGSTLEAVLLGLGDITVKPGLLEDLTGLLPRDGDVAVIADERVIELHPPGLGDRVLETHLVPSGERAKRLAVCGRLWDELRLDRAGTVVALGGGTTTDVAGFVAASYLRGVRWIAAPSTLVGQVDAAIGGKTGIDVERGKNLVGAFHLPEAVAIDPDALATLPSVQRAAGMAEVVKTGLLVGRELWELDDEEMVRSCAAFKTSVCLGDPRETGRRAILNLGHTFAHALEAAGNFERPTHGQAVALGLRAALRLSINHCGLDRDVLSEVERVLPADAADVDPAVAWRSIARDKKARRGSPRLVLLEAAGRPVYDVELPGDEVRRELRRLVSFSGR